MLQTTVRAALAAALALGTLAGCEVNNPPPVAAAPAPAPSTTVVQPAPAPPATVVQPSPY